MSYWESPGMSDEWYTPASVFVALGCSFDLDVAPASDNHHVCAKPLVGDGMKETWEGFVWMNPPFGGRNALIPWLDKFIAHGNGIALVPDRTSAPWFQQAAPQMDLILFTRKIKFMRPDGSLGKSPSNGTALMAKGSLGCAALQRAQKAGFGFMVRGI